jgi:RHS repeat-associated protein
VADRIYAHGNRVDEIVASQYGGVWNYHHYDARGHCIMLTNAAGAIVEQYDYDAFGKPYFYSATGASLPNGSSVGNRFLFTGREWLKDIGVYDFRNRHYLPELGRFIQPDPKEYEAGDYNLYRYCHNDPVNKTDPAGLKAWDTWGRLMYMQSSFSGSFTQFQQARGVPFSQFESVARGRVSEIATKVARGTTEYASTVGIDDNNGTIKASSVYPGNGQETRGQNAGLQTTDIVHYDLPEQYRIIGFVLGHKVFNGKMIEDDRDTAKAHSWHALIVTPPPYGRTNKNYLVIPYDYTKPPRPF